MLIFQRNFLLQRILKIVLNGLRNQKLLMEFFVVWLSKSISAFPRFVSHRCIFFHPSPLSHFTPLFKDDLFGYGLYEGDDGHPYDMLQASLANPSLLTKYKIPPQYHDILISIVRHRLSSNPIKVEAEINLTCFGVDGVDALKAALATAQQHSTEETPITVYVKASPVYVLSATHLDKTIAIDVLTKAIDSIKNKIAEYSGGALEIKTPPKPVTV